MEDEVGEVPDAVRARTVAVMVRVACKLISELRGRAEQLAEVVGKPEPGAVAGAVIEGVR
jgi:hypothetical protein